MKSAMEALEALDHLCSVDGIQVVTRNKLADPTVHKAQEGDCDEYTEDGPECTEEQLEALKQHLPEGYKNVDVAKATKTRQSAEQILKSDSVESKCSKKDCKNPPGCFNYRKRMHNRGKSLYHIMKCPPVGPKPVGSRPVSYTHLTLPTICSV